MCLFKSNPCKTADKVARNTYYFSRGTYFDFFEATGVALGGDFLTDLSNGQVIASVWIDRNRSRCVCIGVIFRAAMLVCD